MPRVVNNITRAEAIQLAWYRRCIRLIRLNSLRISFRMRVASNVIAVIPIYDNYHRWEDAENVMRYPAKQTAVET
jgi:hypothetical protein